MGGGGYAVSNAFTVAEKGFAQGFLKIGASGCKAICGALEQNTIVTEWRHISALTLPCCVSCWCWAAGGGMCCSSLSCDVFGFADDDFGEEGGRAVARMLELNRSLTRLYFASNNFGTAGCCAILRALERNTSLRIVTFQGKAPLLVLCVLVRGGGGEGMIVQGLAVCQCGLVELACDVLGPRR